MSRIVLVDDHPLLGSVLRMQLQAAGHDAECAEVAELGTGEAVIDWVIDHGPDLALVDLGLPFDGGGLCLIGPLVESGIRVSVLTGESDRTLWARCSAAGAEVILDKSEPVDDLMESIGRLLAGRPVKPHQRSELADIYRNYHTERARSRAGFDQLTQREGEILAGLVEGQGANQLADRHIVSVGTVRQQIKSVLRKLDVNSQLAAVARANACNWRLDEIDH
ncbi:MAG: response regulator transcription factor [Acidimicrobiales bacterium]